MSARRTTRREFLRSGALGAGAIASRMAPASGGPRRARASRVGRRPNFLFIISDQLGLDAIAAHGCPDVKTPNLDRLVRSGVSFMESHSTNPVCSPARSSLFTGRMPVETGVISNSRPIHPSVPSTGNWFRQAGYETVYCGKWHLPGGYPTEGDGFTVLPAGVGQGDLADPVVSRSCEAYLKSRAGDTPFVFVASLVQPHDICYWAIRGKELVPEELPFPAIVDQLPELPPNHTAQPPAPERLAKSVYKGFSEEQWRYYIYIYYRQVGMLDADVGRLLDAVEDSGEAEDTIIVFTSDHGEGRGRHQHVQKWYPYEEGVKVPLIFSCPGRMAETHRDTSHLVSGLDVMSTMCDYAGIDAPADCRGMSVRPLLEGSSVTWRDFIVAETHIVGRMVRTGDFKYVRYEGDPVEQLFDMRADPWETRNLYQEAKYAEVVRDHRKLLEQWNAHLKPVPPTPDASRRRS